MRIMILGRPGSGKSTLATELGQHLNLPVYHIDQHFFTQGWTRRPEAEFLAWQRHCVAQDNWIIDGCSRKTFEMRFARADIAIYLDFPRLQCLWRLFKRRIFHASRADARPEGCPETLSWTLIKYLWEFDEAKPQIEDLREKYPQVKFFQVFSLAELKRVIAQLIP